VGNCGIGQIGIVLGLDLCYDAYVGARMGRQTGLGGREGQMRKTGLLVTVLTGVLLILMGCAAVAEESESGVIALVPFADEGFGLRGVRPVEGWTDKAMLLQQSVALSRDELVATLAAQSDLIALPKSIGTYKGRAFTWDLYTFTTRLEEAGPGIYRVDMGLAERDATFYMVTLVSEPSAYAQYEARFDTVYRRALYALEPL